jgi:hypothetical protein
VIFATVRFLFCVFEIYLPDALPDLPPDKRVKGGPKPPLIQRLTPPPELSWQ